MSSLPCVRIAGVGGPGRIGNFWGQHASWTRAFAIEARAVALVAQGKWIEAAKEVRQGTPLGLKDAKEYVDGLRTGTLQPRGRD